MDPKRVATKDGVHSTNMVSIEPGYYLDATYEVTLLQNAIGSTGRLKVIRLVPREGAGISSLMPEGASSAIWSDSTWAWAPSSCSGGGLRAPTRWRAGSTSTTDP